LEYVEKVSDVLVGTVVSRLMRAVINRIEVVQRMGDDYGVNDYPEFDVTWMV
jgi:hypothetical protein